MRKTTFLAAWAGGILVGLTAIACRAESLRIATFNLESYLDVPGRSRPAKSAAARAKIRESLLSLQPDVLALQELGSQSSLLELRDSLKKEGLNLPFWQFLSAADTNIHLGLLSRFDFERTRLYTNESYLLHGRRFHVSRGFAEVDIKVNPTYSLTVLAAHLKSKRTLAEADESEMRLEEAKLLREKIEARLANNPELNLVVLGDFNDTVDSASLRTIIGAGRTKLVDTRPAERNGDASAAGMALGERRCVTWTHFYGKEDSYRRIDFLLLSRGMAREWIADQTYVLTAPNWGLASDHRPLVAAFEAVDR
jgi:endonuclease/exonuclease/phosphatase family metal-dependent hydrolase